ncbi:uncharacterized protein LOC107315164 isoform X2 [Coturnix japonica]|uniref:uncharacterized protein LOC107315164 isoform X2 n=1 Tax=Coturnix japonica TaxID=93934 RepID=UPI000777BB8C|nr:uncharacterized protein LOC107315164 isoform X2 [Coturnix japonica]
MGFLGWVPGRLGSRRVRRNRSLAATPYPRWRRPRRPFSQWPWRRPKQLRKGWRKLPHLGRAPPYYPRLYPCLQSFRSPEGGGSCPREGESWGEARRGGVKPPLDPPPEEGPHPAKGEERKVLPAPTPLVSPPEEGEEKGEEQKVLSAFTPSVSSPAKGEEKGEERKELPVPTQSVVVPRRRGEKWEEREISRKPTDWTDICDTMREVGLKERDWAVFPIVVKQEGPVWVPLEEKGKRTDKELLLVPTRRTSVVSLAVCLCVIAFITGRGYSLNITTRKYLGYMV